jgi:hypothetical protein
VRGERGAATLPMLGVALLTLLLGAFVGDVAIYLRARATATIAADAAALAAAPVTFAGFGSEVTPALEAERFAAANGAVLTSCACAVDPTWQPRVVRVAVSAPADLLLFGTRRVPAVSRAEFDPTALPP